MGSVEKKYSWLRFKYNQKRVYRLFHGMILGQCVRSQMCIALFKRGNHCVAKAAGAIEVKNLTVPIHDKKILSDAAPEQAMPLPSLEVPVATLRTKRGPRTNNNSLPPSLQYVRDVMERYNDHVVLTQMGSFYELYFEHAEIYAPKLNLTLTSREYSHGKVSFAGFPVQHISRHLKVLVKEHGFSVAIADQFKKDNLADNEPNKFLRRVTRIVTPGTFIDEAFENLQENAYLLSIAFPENCFKSTADLNMKIGLCWCDVSTGELFVQEVELKDLVSAVTRIQPREILLDEQLLQYHIESGDWYPEMVELKKFFLKYQKLPSRHRTMNTFHHLFANSDVDDPLRDITLALQDFRQKEIAALRSNLLYIEEHLPDTTVNLQLPQRQLTSSIMQIDSRTSSALELHSTIRNNSKKGSLLSVIRRTVTPSGTRLLTKWLSAPSLDLSEIRNRQILVQFFKDNIDLTESLVDMLKLTYDMPRILQKFSFGKGGAMELIQMSHSMQNAVKIGSFIKNNIKARKTPINRSLRSISTSLSFDDDLMHRILFSLDEEQLIAAQRQTTEDEIDDPEPALKIQPLNKGLLNEFEPWILKPEASNALLELHKKFELLCEEQSNLLQKFRDMFVGKFQAKDVQLKLKATNEYALHILGSSANITKLINLVNEGADMNNEAFRVLQKSSQSCWLAHKSWTDLGEELEYVSMKIKQEERNLINSFKREFIEKSYSIRQLAQALDYLDVLTSFAKLSNEKRLTCPLVDNSRELNITGGRHIVVEDGMQSKCLEKFTENDCKLSSGHLWIVTGPNMGGKSTFLRQNAIIVILAQIGSFVPCNSAHIGLVDKIFSRVGSADDLYNEMSTFMVEMIETSYILKGATDRSLAILDEIGRGTSSKEGVSIAFATLKHLVQRNKCRTLFATHFGLPLKNISEARCDSLFNEKLHYYKSGIVDDGDNFFYDHRLYPGICSRSDALKVAQRAGFPEEALQVAREILD